MSDDGTMPDNAEFAALLDRIIAAVVDGAPVDWASAEARASTAGERDMLAQLRLVEELGSGSDSSTTISALAQTTSTAPPTEHPFALAGILDQDRFVVEERLGQGGFGVVYKAYDRERQTHVALKAFTRPGIESVYAFKHEFRVLTDLTHPNLVALYELFAGTRSWFISMELVPGVNFLTYVRGGQAAGNADGNGTSHASCDLTRLGQAMTQLCGAVAYLHGEGKLHCDIKPSNVLVTSSGHVKLLDFGLATDITRSYIDQETGVLGTPAYVSPEQVAGARPTAASDWYAVGVMLFEALTGERPFHGTVSQVLSAKQHESPPAPAAVLDAVPANLSTFCSWLLEQNPASRPSDEDVLGTIATIWPDSGRSGNAAMLRDHGPFVGRSDEIGRLDESFADVVQGRLHTVFVHGASGIGKSVLVRRFLEALQRTHRDAVILEGRCSERESVPYKALDSLVDRLAQYLRAVPPQDMLAMLPRDCGALARLFPILRRIDAIEILQHAARTIDAQELRRRGGTAFRELLGALVHRHPLVLAVDDLQWMDADSAALLNELLFEPQAPPLLFIGCYRTEEVSSNAALKALLANANGALRRGHCSVTTIPLTELLPAEARQLAQALAHDRASDAAIDAIVTESGRSPLFIHQLVQYSAMATTSAAAPLAAWQGHRAPSGPLTLDSVIRARTASFGDGARRLLQVLALFGEPVELKFAGGVAGLGSAALSDSFALRAARLARSRVTDAEEKLEVYHDRIREAIVSDIPPADLKDLHGRLATALERLPDANPEALVHHLHGAGRYEAAAGYAVIAGDRAAHALAFERAARSYRFALEFGRFEDAGHALRVSLGDALAASGRGYEAAQAYLQAAKTATGDAVVELKRRASEQLLQSGHLDEGMSVVGDVLRRVGLRLAATPRRALFSLLLLRARIALRGLDFTERPEQAIPKDVLAAVDTCWSVTTGLAIIDHIRSAEFGARHLLLALGAGEPLRVVRALAMELAYTSISGAASQRRNEKLIAIANPIANRVANPEARALMILGRGSAAYMQGQWAISRELCEQSTQILREQCTRVAWQTDTAQFLMLLSLFYLGELGELARRLPVLLKEARERDALYAETILRTRLSYLVCLADDNVPAAERTIREGMERWSQQGFHNQHYYEMVAAAETQLYAGRGVAASQEVQRRWTDLARTLLMRVQPVRIESIHLRARTALAAAIDAGADTVARNDLVRHAEKDAEQLRRTGAPWASGLACLVVSGVCTLRGIPALAVDHLRSAEAIFERECMGLYLAVARQRRGELQGGTEGEALVADAHTAMRAQSVRAPDGIARMLAPGIYRSKASA